MKLLTPARVAAVAAVAALTVIGSAFGYPTLDARVTSALDAGATSYAKKYGYKATCRDAMGAHRCLITRGHAIINLFEIIPADGNGETTLVNPAGRKGCWWRLSTGYVSSPNLTYFSVCAANWRKNLVFS